MQTVLQECKAVNASDASFTWVSEDFLLQEKVAAWSEMPLWLPEAAAPHLKGFMFINCDKAVHSGLIFRSLRTTIRDILTSYEPHNTQHSSPDIQNLAGIDRDKEQALLRKWHAR